VISGLHGRIRARWEAMDRTARGAALVSLGSFTLVVMAMLVKQVGTRIPTIEILFFRSIVGFLFVLPMFMHNPLEPLRTKRLGMHAVRGVIGTLGNICFFWTITHMLLADAMALQFSRPLFMIPLAMAFLGEIAGFRRTAITLIGFAGIALYARPFTEGFDPGAFIGAAGALFGALIVICIKRLATTEPTRTIMFYYAISNAVFSLIPTVWFWVTPTGPELAMLVLIGFLGIAGQGLITHGWTLGDVTALVPLDYSRIVYSALLGYLVFGELPGLWSVAGMAIIVASSLYLVLTERRRLSA
jgi:drug/metabolite transporter (DMT)-like permease